MGKHDTTTKTRSNTMHKLMGKFTAIGMREAASDPTGLYVNTCSDNDTNEVGTLTRWSWSNPTNREIAHHYEDVVAVSVECLWQGTKLLPGDDRPDEKTLKGNWRRGKGKRPKGAWAGEGQPLITNQGEARRRIYIPAFRNLIDHQLQRPEVQAIVDHALRHSGNVYLRDFDTGRGIDRNGPMSHAWVLAVYLNTGDWPR